MRTQQVFQRQITTYSVPVGATMNSYLIVESINNQATTNLFATIKDGRWVFINDYQLFYLLIQDGVTDVDDYTANMKRSGMIVGKGFCQKAHVT